MAQDARLLNKREADTRVRAALIFSLVMAGFVLVRSFISLYSPHVYGYVFFGTLCSIIAYFDARRGGEPLAAFALLICIASVGHMHSVVVGAGFQSATLVWGILWPAAGMLMVGRRFGLCMLVANLLFYIALISLGLEGGYRDESPENFRSNPSALLTSVVIISVVISCMLWIDKTREINALEHEQERADRDFLTKLLNRGGFECALEAQFDSGQRFGLLAIDVDHFKYCNDNLGHEAGDECLRQIAAALSVGVRGAGDTVARTGGDEFSVLLPGISQERLTVLAERMRDGISQLNLENGNTGNGQITVTIGTACFDASHIATSRSARQMADKALYLGKREGRNRVRELSESELAEFRERAAE